jgi:hypothetical protein
MPSTSSGTAIHNGLSSDVSAALTTAMKTIDAETPKDQPSAKQAPTARD